jgi:hypothetical protein
MIVFVSNVAYQIVSLKIALLLRREGKSIKNLIQSLQAHSLAKFWDKSWLAGP